MQTAGHEDLKKMFVNVIHGTSTALANLVELDSSSISSKDIDYLRELCTLSVDSLGREGNNLKNVLAELNTNLKSDLYVSDRNIIEPSVESIEMTVANGVCGVRDRLHSLDVSCDGLRNFRNYREEKLKVRNLLSNYSALIDLLEIPQLMESCVRNHHYAEALALHDYTQNLLRAHSTNPLVSLLLHQVRAVRSEIVALVTSSLSEKVLRLHEVQNMLLIYRLLHPEVDEMCMHFLVLRVNFLRLQKSRLDHSLGSSSASFKLVKDYSEILRLHLVELFTQFTSLFPTTNLVFLLRFVHAELDLFLTCLDSNLPKLTASFAHLGQTFQVTSDLCDALGKLGFSFHPIVLAKYNSCVVECLAGKTSDVFNSFQAELAKFDWKPFLSLLGDAGSMDPIQLTRFRPLALLFNDLTGLANEVRAFPLLALRGTFVEQFDSVLVNAFELLLIPRPNVPELDTARDMFCSILVLHVESYLERIFSEPVQFSQVRSKFR